MLAPVMSPLRRVREFQSSREAVGCEGMATVGHLHPKLLAANTAQIKKKKVEGKEAEK